MNQKKVPMPPNWLITKNLQFLNNHHETLAKFTTHEMLILRKFHNDWIKILDFLLSVNIIACALFYDSPSITMGVLGKICPKIPRNVIFARISLFLVPMALTCIKEHMKIEKGRWRSQRPFQRPETQMMRNQWFFFTFAVLGCQLLWEISIFIFQGH